MTPAYTSESDKVPGRISTTADCWSSDFKDGYLGVTAHWIERTAPGVWTLKADLLAYTHLRYSHTGERLGQALFKILDRIGIARKVRLTSLRRLHAEHITAWLFYGR